MIQAMGLQSKVLVLVIALHVLLLVGVQLSPQRATSANSMGDLVTASLLDPNPQLEKKTTPAPKPEKKMEPKVENNKILSASIDIIAILTTVIGIATSLGLGASQINGGLQYVFDIQINEFIIIVIITIIGLISVCLGLDVGIKRLSQMNMLIAICLLVLVLLLGPTVFILNAMVQNAGVYLNQLIQLSTWTEAYNSSVYQNGYTLFYFTWWFAWAPFVSLFIARISYGRTIKEFVIGVLIVPSLIVFIWMGVFGNAAIYLVLNGIGDIGAAVSGNASTALFVLFDSLSFAKPLSIISLISSTSSP